MITNGDITIIVGGSIVLFILFMIARYYGNWNMLIYGPLIVLIPLAMFGGGNSGSGGAGFEAMLILIFIFPIYYLINYIIKNYFNKNSPVNNRRSNNNRSNNTRTSTAEYLN